MEKSKKTKKQYYTEIKEYIKDNKELLDFVEREMELLTRKNSGNSNKKATEENQKLTTMILGELEKETEGVTITALMNKSEIIKGYTLENGKPLSNQKINAILQEQIKTGTVVNVKDKKASYFSIKK